MARYLCQICYNVVAYGENHPCFYYKNDEVAYSLPRTRNSDEKHEEAKVKFTKNLNDDSRNLNQSVLQSTSNKSEMINVSAFQSSGKVKLLPSRRNRFRTSAQSSNDAQKRNVCDNSYFNAIPYVQMTQVQLQDDASFKTSSDNVVCCSRPENDFREADNLLHLIMESTGIEELTQRGSVISDLIHAKGHEGNEMSRQEKKWKSLNKIEMIVMDSPECVIRTRHSDNSNVSAPRNLVMNNVFPTRSNQIENGKKHVSEYVTDGHNSLEMDSNLYSKSRKTASTAKQRISSERNNNAVAGPSGMCTGKKKFSCPSCSKEFNYKSNFDIHYRSHTKEKPFVCKFCEKAFSENGNLKVHIRIHTGKKPFECKVCKEVFRQISTLQTHIKTHTREKPYKCPVCGKAFSTSSARNMHQRNIHK